MFNLYHMQWIIDKLVILSFLLPLVMCEDVKRVYNQFQNIFYMPSVNTTINIIYKIFYYYG